MPVNSKTEIERQTMKIMFLLFMWLSVLPKVACCGIAKFLNTKL